MNSSVYIFGSFKSGYSQYPDDYSSAIFQQFYTHSKATTQVAIHRDGDLMYYGYVRKLEQGKYIGFCVVLNGIMITRLDDLFPLFEKTVSNLVEKGHLIHFSDSGEVVSAVEKLYLNREEVDLISNSLTASFNTFEPTLQKLPPQNFATQKDSVENYNVGDAPEEILKSSHTNSYTFIYKSKDYNTAQMLSYQAVLAKNEQEKKDLTYKLNFYQTEYGKVLKRKKQFKVVLVLLFFLFVCAIGLLAMLVGLFTTRSALSNANETIDRQTSEITSQSAEIDNLNSENYRLDESRRAEANRRQEAEDNLEQLRSMIGGRQPFIVRNTQFDFNNGYLTFDYYGFVEETVDIQVRAFGEDGEVVTNSGSIEIFEGDNTAMIYLSSSLDSGKWYSFELLKGNTILSGDRH